MPNISVAPLRPFFEWCAGTTIATSMHDSMWAFPLVETIHIFALTLLYGSILIVDLRLLGAGLTRQPTSKVAASMWPWMIGSLALLLSTGILLFLSEAMTCYGNSGFTFKMMCLVLALLFHFTVFRRLAATDAGPSPFARKLVALVSLALWLGVGIGGRAIGFV